MVTQWFESVLSLEDKLQKMEVDLQRQTLINTQFESEFRHAQNDLKKAMCQMEELQVWSRVTLAIATTEPSCVACSVIIIDVI